MRWIPSAKSSVDESHPVIDKAPYAMQVARQINYGPQEWIRYFVPTVDGTRFAEMNEESLIKSNFEKLNSYEVPVISTILYTNDETLLIHRCLQV
jgi:hypothetical protein